MQTVPSVGTGIGILQVEPFYGRTVARGPWARRSYLRYVNPQPSCHQLTLGAGRTLGRPMSHDLDQSDAGAVILQFPSGMRVNAEPPLRDPHGVLELIRAEGEDWCLVDGCMPVAIAERLMADYGRMRAEGAKYA